MGCRELAGVLGTRHDNEVRHVFRVVSGIRADEIVEERDLFRKLHSMFLIDYHTWREERKYVPAQVTHSPSERSTVRSWLNANASARSTRDLPVVVLSGLGCPGPYF